MTFDFEGDQYRIGFQHDKPREWRRHVGHEVGLILYAMSGKDVPALWCSTCELKLAPLSKDEQARNVGCRIFHWAGDSWVALFTGRSRLNVEAGDQYDREKGRRAALHDALGVGTRKEFREACWRAYLERARGKTDRLLNRVELGEVNVP